MKILYIGNNHENFSEISEMAFLDLKIYDQIAVPEEHVSFEADFKLDDICKNYIYQYNKVKVLLIDLDWFENNDYLGARLAHHIRLTKWKVQAFREIPIILLRDHPVDIVGRDILKEELFIFAGVSKGAYFATYSDITFDTIDPFSTVDRSFNVYEIARQHGLNFIYNTYLRSLKFTEEYDDRHSITNQWGALRLAACIGYEAEEIGYNWPPKLYFKFLQAKHNFKKAGDKPKEYASVLLIDDNADKGWEKVLKKLFGFDEKFPKVDIEGRPTFRVINEKVDSYESLSADSKNIIENQQFDLYLIDLRLNGSEEAITTDTKKYSGYRVLYKIKSLNEGNQVIMFTASDKAWNMRALMGGDKAADGYYIKESALNASDKVFGKDNTRSFLEQIRSCLKLHFLKQIAETQSYCINHINSIGQIRSHSHQDFFNRAKSSFAIAFELCKRSVDGQKFLNLAYLAYYQILEDYAGLTENFELVSKRECYVNNHMLKVIDTNSGSTTWLLTYVYDPTNGSYFKRGPSISDATVTSLAKISFILAYKFNFNNQSLKSWGRLNEARNSKAVHGGNQGLVSVSELMDLLNIVKLFLTNS
jgi:CheY-like chemotaxis protein